MVLYSYIVKKVDEKLNELIEIIFVQGRQNYGTRRIKDKLIQRYGLIVSRRLIGAIMRDLGLVAKTKKRYKINTTDSNNNLSPVEYEEFMLQNEIVA